MWFYIHDNFNFHAYQDVCLDFLFAIMFLKEYDKKIVYI